jgi:hypothetical protein
MIIYNLCAILFSDPIFESTEEARLPLTPFYEIMKGIHMK